MMAGAMSSRVGVTLLKQRVITAVIVVALFYTATAWFPLTFFTGFVSLVTLIALLEWANLAGWSKPVQRAAFVGLFTAVWLISLIVIGLPVSGGEVSSLALALLNVSAIFYWLVCYRWVRRFPEHTDRWGRAGVMTAMGVVSLLPVWWALVWLRMIDDRGLLVFVLVALVSVSDIGAYFTGRAWGRGRARLAGALSPNKSWVGFWGGMGSCMALAAVLLLVTHVYFQRLEWWMWPTLLLGAAGLAAFGVLGDLCASMLKRRRGVKDSGRILPGHGGVLDRIDSLLPASPVFVLIVITLLASTGKLS